MVWRGMSILFAYLAIRTWNQSLVFQPSLRFWFGYSLAIVAGVFWDLAEKEIRKSLTVGEGPQKG